jgi:hypothetical protein
MAVSYPFVAPKGNGTLTVTKYSDGSAVFQYVPAGTGQTGFWWHATSAQVGTLNTEIDSGGVAGAPTDDATTKVLPFDGNL